METSARCHAGNGAAGAEGFLPDEGRAAASKRTPGGLRLPCGAVATGFRILSACLLLISFAIAPSPAVAQSEGDLRIVPHNANSPEKGRLEIYHTPDGGAGRWGPICDDDFYMEEAKVACKQMGYKDAENYITRYGKDYAWTEAGFWLDDIDCNGTESKLTDCRQKNNAEGGYYSELQWANHDCVPLEQVGVECTTDTAKNAILIDKRELTVVEGRSTTFKVWLGKAPTAAVTVTLGKQNGGDLKLKKSGSEITTLAFTTTNWANAQTVTVEAASDDDTTDNTGITISISPPDSGYDDAESETLKVVIRDDDTKGISITPTSLNTFETNYLNERQINGVYVNDFSGREGTPPPADPLVRSYTVRMKAPPTANVKVDIEVTANTPGGDGEADVAVNPPTLTFTTSNWYTPQTVTPTITADDDSDSEIFTLSHTVTSNDSGYDDMNLPDVTVEVKETRLGNPRPALSVADAEANENDDASLDFKVRLYPSWPYAVTVKYETIARTATAGADYTETSGTLTFAPGETEKTVSVPIINDNIEDDGETLWLKLSEDFCSNGILSGLRCGGFDDQWGLGTIRNTETTEGNTAPTGLPTISGTARVGETLTASRTGIADADGLANAAFAWQWIADDGTSSSDIVGATSETYTLTSAEQGKTVKVRVTFTDDGSAEETLTSAATETVAAAVQEQAASDTEAPTVMVTSDATGPVTDDFDVKVTFSEPVTGFEKSELAIVNGAASGMTANEAGDAYTVTITPDAGASGTLTAQVPAGVASDAAGNANTASGAFGIAVKTALKASFSEVPSSHDGSSVFTFKLTFSEEFDLSYRTLRDAAFEVTGGTVRKAPRLQRGSNIGWTIHVEPDTDGDLVVTLPVRACSATGAMCTDDDRALAKAVSATIPGPASPPRVSIAAAASPVTEGAAAAFTLSRRGGPTTALTVDLGVSEDGSVVDGTAPATATFAAGSATATLTVATEDDEAAESASVVTATVSAGTGYALDSGEESASVTVEDDDAAPLVTNAGPFTVEENKTAVATLAATDDDTAAADLAWSLAGGADEDAFTLSADGVLAFKAAKDFESPDDADNDGSYEVTVRVTDGANPVEAALTVSLTDVDEAAPALSDASVDGDTLTLTFDAALDENESPASSAFSVKVEEAARDVSAVSVSGSSVTLTLASAVSAGETVTVGYTVPTGDGASPLQDAADNPVAAFSDEAVTNATGAGNAAPTGLPAISGTARVGETLTASESGIADADGLTDTTFAWQWIANDGTEDTDIADATSETYTLTAAEQGKTIKVRVTFTDDAGAEETLVSEATEAVESLLTVRSASVPSSHDGSTAFTIKLHFSEEVSLSAQTLREDSLEVIGGDVSRVQKQDPASSADWTVTITPSGNEYISVRLPTRDSCNASGAVCTADDKLLSNQIVETIPGPNETSATPVKQAGAGEPVTVPADWSLKPADIGEGEQFRLIFVTSGRSAADSTSIGDYDAFIQRHVGAGHADIRQYASRFKVIGSMENFDARDHTGTNPRIRKGGLGVPIYWLNGPKAADDNRDFYDDGWDHFNPGRNESGASVYFGSADTVWTGTQHGGQGYPSGHFGHATNIKVGRPFINQPISRGYVVKSDDGNKGKMYGISPIFTVAVSSPTLPTITIEATSSPVTEGTAAAFTLSRTGDTTAELSIAVSVSEAGSVISGTPASTVTFAAGDTEATLSVTTENDAVDEADARVTVSVSAGSGYTVNPDEASAGVDVYDDDAAASGGETVTTLWSSTLEWTDMNGDWIITNTADFTSPGWSEDGKDFKVWYFAYGTDEEQLWLRLASPVPAGGIPDAGELTLHVGGAAVEAGDALSDFAGGRIGIANAVSQDWEEGDRVSVRLTRTEAAESTASLPGLSVADAQVNESDGAPLSFVVTLSDAQTTAVSVRYATSDGTATAGADYEAVSGILRFEAGETSKTVSVPVLNDEHDDDGETLTLTLSSSFGAEITDATATGTINNTDPMPRAWLARFGRAAAEHVADAIGERLRGGAGAQVTLAGRSLDFGFDPQLSKDDGRAHRFAKNDSASALPALLRDSGEDTGRHAPDKDGEVSLPDLLLASSFHLASAENAGAGHRWSVWGRGARSAFDGVEGTLTLEGEVTTATLGLDYEHGRWLLGVALSRSAGEGSYLGDATCRGGCDIESALTGVYPYARYRVSERLSLWGVIGHGQGDLTLETEGSRDIDTDIEMRMAAAGARGVVLPAQRTGGFELAVRTDLLVTRTSSDAAAGLVTSEAETSRLRLLLEGSRTLSFGDSAALTPSVELGLRYDGGDAERGSGLELGASLRYASGRLEVEVSARGLLAHAESDYEEWGVSGAVRLASGADGRGLSMRLGSGLGADSGNAERLWSGAHGAFGAGVFDPAARMDAEVAYGFDAPRGLLTPYTGVAYSQDAETWRAGARWNLGPEYEVSVEASLTEHAGDEKPESGLLLRGSKRW